MGLAYLTEAWAEQALQAIETDESLQAVIKGHRVSLLSIILGAPSGRYNFIYAAFDEGGLSDYRVGHDYEQITNGIDKPTFVVSGQYDVFAQIQRGELTERKAILSGKLHLTGSWTKALRYMRTLETLTDALSRIECET